jgi:hypothetical protein
MARTSCRCRGGNADHDARRANGLGRAEPPHEGRTRLAARRRLRGNAVPCLAVPHRSPRADEEDDGKDAPLGEELSWRTRAVAAPLEKNSPRPGRRHHISRYAPAVEVTGSQVGTVGQQAMLDCWFDDFEEGHTAGFSSLDSPPVVVQGHAGLGDRTIRGAEPAQGSGGPAGSGCLNLDLNRSSTCLPRNDHENHRRASRGRSAADANAARGGGFHLARLSPRSTLCQ